MPGSPAARGCSRSRNRTTDTLIDLDQLGWPAAARHRRPGSRSRRPAGSPSSTNSRRRRSGSPRRCCASAAIRFLASFKIWNAATVGGNICMSLPAGADDLADRRRWKAICTLWPRDGAAARGGGGRLRHRQPLPTCCSRENCCAASICRPPRWQSALPSAVPR